MSHHTSSHSKRRLLAGLTLSALALLAACADQPTSPAASAAAGKASGNSKPETFLFSGTQTGVAKIYVANADGSNVRQLTTGAGEDVSPNYQPGSKRFVWIRRQANAGGGEMWTALANGASPKRLTPEGMLAANPEYSPDGKKIAFDAFVAGQGARAVFIINADGSGLRMVTSAVPAFSSPTWSPFGDKLAIVGDSPSGIPSIYLLELNAGDGPGPQVIVDCTVQPGCSDPDINPAGSMLAFVDNSTHQLGVLADATGAITYVSGGSSGPRNPTWSRNGDRILFDSDLLDDSRDVFAIQSDDPVGSVFVRLTKLGGEETAPAASR
jgi:Tol biopolymer transport system component